MKVVRPITITDSNLTSSTVPETDYPLWVVGTAYAVGAYVIRTTGLHRIYQCLVANTGVAPETSTLAVTTSPKWLDTGPTNTYGMFDSQVGTATTVASSLTVVIAPGTADSLGLLQLVGDSVRVSMVSGSTTVYDKTYSLSYGASTLDWYGYFFNPISKKTDLVITDMPPYYSGVITITITAASGNVSCGMCVVGPMFDLGYTQAGATVGIIDYSRKDIDAFGNPYVTLRKFVKKMDSKVFVSATNYDLTAQTLAKYRSTPCLWIGSDNVFTSLIVYGIYRDWSLDISNPYSGSMCSLTIEGFI